MDAAPHPTAPRWHVRLLGGLQLNSGPQQITRLPSRAVAALLARLALWPERVHAREELVELLWPGVDLAVGRNRLRQALSTLKSLLEAPGQPPVLLADRLGVTVVAGALACDAREFEQHLRAGRHDAAAAWYRGELLPGFYDEWIDDERRRLVALAERLPAPGAAPAAVAGSRPTPPPAPPSPDLGRATLPAYLTRFFGAEEQAAQLRDAVLAHRLVTLSGPGGSGKTRLAVEVAHAALAAQAFDLVVFVPLAACNDAAAMHDTLLTTLRVRSGAGDAVERLERLAQGLAGRHVLLVLDNVEQLLPQAAAIVAQLGAVLPRLHLLVTSRRLLDVDGEHEFRVAPLALPPAAASLGDAAASPAVALFVDRARAARADFHLGARNAEVLAQLVRALQGLPLAIELAASRVRSFTPAEMLARLQAPPAGDGSTPGLDLLARSGPRAGFDPRHATMHRVIQWSWQQLAPQQAALLAALTVFEGGFTAAAAQAVSDESDVQLALDTLISHSLLLTHEGPGGTLRFALYEPIREFAAAQLDTAACAVLRARHRAWWPRWAAGFGPTPPLAAVRAELPNIEAALASALADGAPDDALTLVLALRPALNDVSLPASALARVAAALDASNQPLLRSRAHTLLGVLSFDAGQRDAARHHVERGLALAPAGGAVRARALHALASVRWRSERNAGPLLPLLDAAQALAEGADDIESLASICALRAYIANVHDRDYARGEALHRQALALWERLGNEHAINGGIYNLAICAFNARRWTEALLRLEAVCANAREQDDWQQLSSALNVQGNTLAALHEWPRAWRAYRDCVEMAFAAVEPLSLAYGLWNAPRALAHLRRAADAGRLMGFAAMYWRGHFGPLTDADRLDLRRVRRLVAVQIGHADTAAAFADGERLSLADAVALLRQPL